MHTPLGLLLVFGAGILSVVSPCVLPVLPVVVAGSENDHRLRPLFVVGGLGITFMAMGVLSSLFGSFFAGKTAIIEKVAAVLIVLTGLLLVFNVNVFKRLSIGGLRGRSGGRLGGLVLGATLGLVWIPCVGPVLSSVLAMVAARGKLIDGILLLAVYTAGFAVPMLIAAYASQFFRSRMRKIGRFSHAVTVASGLLLVALGGFIFIKGMIGFSLL